MDVLVREILPIFAPTIQRLQFLDVDLLIKCHSAWPTILPDLTRLNSIDAHLILPSLGDDHLDAPTATSSAGQALFKWLHTPRKDGQPKLLCSHRNDGYYEWIDNFKKAFLRATTLAAAYTVQFPVSVTSPIAPFELVNERTQEKLTLMLYVRVEKLNYNGWELKRCPISEKAATDQWEDAILDDLNDVSIDLHDRIDIGQLSPPPAAEEEAGQSN